MNIKENFGKKVKEYRIKLSLTQEELAEKIGISAKSLSQIELGNNFVSAETLDAICNALNVQPKNMFDFSDNITKNKFDYVERKLKNNKHLTEKIFRIIDIIE